MAAYAAVISLENILDQIQNHPHLSLSRNEKQQIQSLHEKVSPLREFMETYSHGLNKEYDVWESQLASASCAAEDLIESHIVDQINSRSVSFLDLREMIEAIDCISGQVLEFKSSRGLSDFYCAAANSSSPMAIERDNSTMVGFEDKLIQLMEELTGPQLGRRVIPIVGMGGIGKTTLVKNVYEKSLIVQHFDIRAWATISQQYNLKEILLGLVKWQERNENSAASGVELALKSEEELGEKLHKCLWGRRYLIVLDDIWSTEAWDRISVFFPENNNSSRVVVTTRLSNVVNHFNSSCLEMNLLDENQSWDLFCEKAFAGGGCTAELEEIGHRISKRCKGLPLSISVIGALIGKCKRSREYWEGVAEDVNSILNSSEEGNCLDLLSLSYNHLPAYLKPCFLYMAIFPEDHDIRTSRLIKLWVAEGFLKPSKSHSLEGVAENCIRDLVDRNLISIRRLGSTGKIKTCNIHDLLRDVCLRIGVRENFLCVVRMADSTARGLDNARRIVFHESIPNSDHDHPTFHALQSAHLVRSFKCEGGQLPRRMKLLRVLSTVDDDSLETIFGQVNLRYLAYEHLLFSYSRLPLPLSFLWNLQTVIIKGAVQHIFAPLELWAMPLLRHIEIDNLCLPKPPHGQRDVTTLWNLQTLTVIMNFRWSTESCSKIPNVKKLYIQYEDDFKNHDCLRNLRHLSKLESLKCLFSGSVTNRINLMENLNFPSSLVKLTLKGSCLQWDDLSVIGSLPKLEVLKLKYNSVRGPEWKPVEGEFVRLKVLEIHCGELTRWDADGCHFPVLEVLALVDMQRLREIPLGVGDIATLRLISFWCCGEAAVMSALRIAKERESAGNEGLGVGVVFWDEESRERFWANARFQGFKSSDFRARTVV